MSKSKYEIVRDALVRHQKEMSSLEMAISIGCCKKTAKKHLNALYRNGLAERIDGKAAMFLSRERLLFEV